MSCPARLGCAGSVAHTYTKNLNHTRIELAAGPDAADDALLLFVRSMAEAQALAPGAVAVAAAVQPEGVLWVAYPKGSAKAKIDINRDTLWPVMQQYGWRPVRQVALDETWSALRLRPGQWDVSSAPRP